GVQIVNSEINNYLPDTLTTSQKVKLEQEIFNNIKSYLFSSKDLGLFTDFALSERKRLFIDVKDVNQSLASILNELSKESWFKKNNFLNSLSFDINSNGDPSRVIFEATTGENFDERSIYEGLLSLLSKKTPIGDFNGISYTTQGLAQDLIAAAFLE